ncbi:hypothetical protein ACRAWF_02150 [Streptomyces sp. L7]
MTTASEPRVSGLEIRSIDYVPLDERHGKLWHLGPCGSCRTRRSPRWRSA